MEMSQCNMIVDKLNTNAVLYEDEIVEYLISKGASKSFDSGLLYARISSINENKKKYGIAENYAIVSTPFLVDGYTKRLYAIGREDSFIPIKVTKDVKKTLKSFYTTPIDKEIKNKAKAKTVRNQKSRSAKKKSNCGK